MNKDTLLDDGHWNLENYTQRITSKQWKELLLAGDDYIIYHASIRPLVCKNMGFGVVEVSKKPLPISRGEEEREEDVFQRGTIGTYKD